MTPFVLFIIALVVSLLQLSRSTGKKTKSKITELFLKNILLFVYGIGGIIGFISLVFMPERTAQLIGWNTQSPFQYEMGIVWLGIGVLGIMSLFYRGIFWLAMVVFTTIFGWGLSIGLIYNLRQQDTNMPSVIREYMWADILIPLVILALFIAHLRLSKMRLR